MTSNVDHLFVHLLAYLEKCLFGPFANFFNWVICLFVIKFSILRVSNNPANMNEKKLFSHEAE